MIVLEGQVLSADAKAAEGLKPTKVVRVLVDGEVDGGRVPLGQPAVNTRMQSLRDRPCRHPFKTRQLRAGRCARCRRPQADHGMAGGDGRLLLGSPRKAAS